MTKFRHYMRKKKRHFKYWLARKMFPDGDLNFLVIPEQTEVNLKQLTCTELHNKTHWAFIGEDLIKEHMISDMMANLKKYLEYEEKDDGANVLCIGTITVATR